MKSKFGGRFVQKPLRLKLFMAACALFLGGCSSASLTSTSTPPPDTTPPTTPANLTATAVSPVQINLTWTASTDKAGVSGYQVERCEGVGCTSFAQVATPTATSFSDEALTGSTSYSYRVRATDPLGNVSAYSAVATASTMAPTFTAPTNAVAVAAGSTQVNVTWTAATETGGTISQYLVERCEGAGCANFAQVGTSATASYSDTGLTGSTSYSYRVRATDAAKDLSPYSNTATVTTTAPTLTAPSNLVATAASSTQINLSWTGSTETGGTLSKYLVERCQGAGCTNFAQVGTSTTTSYSDTGLTASMTYSYRVRATDASGDLSPYSNIANATTPGPNLPTAPANLTATSAGPTQINLAWTASTETGGTIAQYLVERCAGAGCANFVQVGTSATTSYSDTGLTGSTSYSYRVRALDGSNNLGPYSNTATATTAAPTLTAPANLTATAASSTQINLTWTAATETGGTISKYLVQRCAGAGCTNFAQVGTSATASYSDTGLSGSTSYSYRVQATDALGDLGPFSNTATATTAAPTPTAPANLTATAASAVQINLSWTAATETGGTIGQYLVERCEGTGCTNFAQVGTSATTSYSDTGLTASTSYSYRVRATDSLGDLGPYSNTATATTTAPTFTAPGNLMGTVASAVQINLTWTAATETGGTISGYQIQRCQGTGCTNFAQVGTSTTTSYSDTGLNGSTNYSYRVRATDSSGNNGPFSTVFSGTTTAPTLTAPTNLTATAVSNVQVNLSWTAATETGGTISQYLVQRCAGVGCTNFAQVGTSTTASYNDTGLNGSTSYSYRVQATDALGDLGPFSNTGTATTAAPTLTAPSNLTAIATSSAQINLSWTAATETGGTISQYLVQRCAGTGCSNFAQVGTSATTSYNDTGLTASTTYSYQVQATDAGGDLSGFSNIATATTTALSNISVSITPTQGGLTLSQTLPFTATVTNDVGAAGVTWSSSGGTLTGQTLTAATFSSTTAGSFTITATSNANNAQSASATIGVTNLAGMYTYHNDLSRDGVNSQEYALTTANVASATFGKLFSCTADAPIYAQPLWVANLNIGGGTHNVVFVATVHDTVFAFDADASPCVTYWSTSLLGSNETWVSYSDVGTTDIYPDIGVIGTPVIEPATNTIYVVAKSKTNGTSCTPATSCFQRLHALSLINGSEQFGGPVNISSAISVPGTGDGSSGGNVAFNTLTQNQRPGLALSNGVVYVTWASHGDNPPYHGWVLGFSESTLALVATFNCNPNGSDTGIWMSGGAPAADSSGNLYFLTGNGTFDVNTGGSDYGDSTVKLSTSSGLAVAGYFTPADQYSLDVNDTDHGSGGAAILVDQPPSAPVQHLMIGGGKEGNMFLLNRDNLGGYGGSVTPNDSNAVQKFSVGNGIFSTAAFFNNGLYVGAISTNLQVFAFNAAMGQFSTTSTSQSPTSFGFPGATPSISALGTSNAIVWALNNNQFCTGSASLCGPAILHAYDATNLATELWNSSQNSGDAAGNAVKFTVPTVANGKVYVGTRGNDTGGGGTTVPGELDVYGLKPN